MADPNKPRALEDVTRAGDARLFSPSAARNRDPVLKVLREVLPAKARLLEIASGTGEHAVHVCAALPQIEWQPSERDNAALASIAAWRAATDLPNLHAPLTIDVMAAEWWHAVAQPVHVVLSLNMIHIAPWGAAQGLFAGAGQLLGAEGTLILYGPFARGGVHTAPSNAAFDESLKSRDPEWGVRDIDDLDQLAREAGLVFERGFDMPANNQTLVFRKGRL